MFRLFWTSLVLSFVGILAQQKFISFNLFFKDVGLIPQNRANFLKAIQYDISTILTDLYHIDLNGTCFNMSNIQIKRYRDLYKTIDETKYQNRRLQSLDKSFVADVFINTNQFYTNLFHYNPPDSRYIAINLLHIIVTNQTILKETIAILEPFHLSDWVLLESPIVQTEKGAIELTDYKPIFPMSGEGAKAIYADIAVFSGIMIFVLLGLSIICYCSTKPRWVKEIHILNPIHSMSLLSTLRKEPVLKSADNFHREYVGSVDLRNGKGAAILINSPFLKNSYKNAVLLDSPLHSRRYNAALLFEELKKQPKPIVKPVFIDLELDLDL